LAANTKSLSVNPPNFMRPYLDAHFSISQIEVGMMPLFLRDFADTVGKFQSMAEIGKLELPFQSFLLHYPPVAVQLFLQLPKRIALQCQRSSVAWLAILFCQRRTHIFVNQLSFSRMTANSSALARGRKIGFPAATGAAASATAGHFIDGCPSPAPGFPWFGPARLVALLDVLSLPLLFV
jgi:hypothetical protein